MKLKNLYTGKPYLHVLIALAIVAAVVFAAHTRSETKTDYGTMQPAITANGMSQTTETTTGNTGAEPAADSYTAEIREKAIAGAERAAAGGDYESAIRQLTEALTIVGDDEELSARYAALCGEYKLYLVSNTETIYGTEGYSAVEKMIRSARRVMGDEGALMDVMEFYRDKYVEDTIFRAEETFTSDGYDAALAVLTEGVSVLGQDAELSKAIDAYRTNKRPVALSGLSYYLREGKGAFYHKDSAKDIFGNEHSDVIYVGGGFSSTTCYASQTYRIDKKYGRFTGTVFLCDCGKNTEYAGTIKIYGDGELIYSLTDIGKGFETVSFDLDISQVTDLTIYLNDPDFYGCGGDRGLSDALLYPA